MSKKPDDIFEPLMPIVPPCWDILPFQQAASVISDNGRHVKQGAYLPAGKLLVIDQGQNSMGGYTDDETMAFNGELPVILFGDHTRSIKFVDKRFAVGAEGIKILKPTPNYNPKFFYYLLRSLQIPSRGYSRHFQFLKKFHLPIAPPNEQKLIVAEIEKQFSRLDEAVAGLKRIKANLKCYKAAVLKAAVEGKLTADWREKNLPAPMSRPGKFYTYAILCDDDSIYIGHTADIASRWNEHLQGKGSEWTAKHKPVQIAHYEEFDNRQEATEKEKWLKTGFGRKWIKRELVAGRTRQAGGAESGEVLLKRILIERKKRWEEKNPGKKYKEPVAPDTSNLPELPKGWVWATVEQIAYRVQYGSSAKTNEDQDGVPVIRMGNIFEGRLKLGDLKYLPRKHSEFPELLLIKNDLLFNRTNSPELVGKTAVYMGSPASCSFASYLIRVQFNDNISSPFVSHFINSAHGRKWIKNVVTQQVGQANVNGTKLQALTVPLPPYVEQKKITEEVEGSLSVAEEIDAQVDANLKRAERLRQGILKKAFSGKLIMIGVSLNA